MFKLTAILFLSASLLLGGMSCNSSPGGEPSSQTAQQNQEPRPSASEDEAKNENANATGDDEKAPSANATKNLNGSMNPQPKTSVPSAYSAGATRVQMRNVDFRTDDAIVLRIREMRGALLRKSKATPPVFDDKRSFIMRIDSGTIGIRTDSLSYLMNDYVFAYPKAPLKKLNISTQGNQLKMTGKMHKGLDIPFKIIGNIEATPEGKIRLHPTSIKAAGIPVKGLMKMFGVELDELLKTSESRGVRMDDNDIIMDPELMLPPPTIRGRIVAVRVEGDEVVQDFGAVRGGSAHVAARQGGSNFMYFHGGTIRFGKLTMNNADLRIVDASPTDRFDFSLDHYNSQLVAGHSKNTSDFGLIVVMPDYFRLRQASVKQSNSKEGSGLLSKR